MILTLHDILPTHREVLRAQGVPENAEVKEEISYNLSEAFRLFELSANPKYLFEEISVKEFEEIYTGLGKNELDTPVEKIFPRAKKLALFIMTVGSEVTKQIEKSFSDNEILIGSLIDSIASLSVENAVERLEGIFFNKWKLLDEDAVLGYSPGYCGWHLNVQEKIFAYLLPERIGVSLNESYLMDPLKSVSGVLIGSKKDNHIFRNNYQFCGSCKNRTCISRMNKLLE